MHSKKEGKILMTGNNCLNYAQFFVEQVIGHHSWTKEGQGNVFALDL